MTVIVASPISMTRILVTVRRRDNVPRIKQNMQFKTMLSILFQTIEMKSIVPKRKILFQLWILHFRDAAPKRERQHELWQNSERLLMQDMVIKECQFTWILRCNSELTLNPWEVKQVPESPCYSWRLTNIILSDILDHPSYYTWRMRLYEPGETGICSVIYNTQNVPKWSWLGLI